MLVEWKKRKKVDVSVGACSRELLTWVLMKMARVGDHVIIVHIVTTFLTLIYKEKHTIITLQFPLMSIL
jgi:hypothetical protein